jgi:hypothetical protein
LSEELAVFIASFFFMSHSHRNMSSNRARLKNWRDHRVLLRQRLSHCSMSNRSSHFLPPLDCVGLARATLAMAIVNPSTQAIFRNVFMMISPIKNDTHIPNTLMRQNRLP